MRTEHRLELVRRLRPDFLNRLPRFPIRILVCPSRSTCASWHNLWAFWNHACFYGAQRGKSDMAHVAIH